MRVLLTGAAGRLGEVLWKNLLDAGHTVYATDRRYRAGLPGPLVLADLTDEVAAYRMVQDCDAIAHVGNLPNVVYGRPQEVYRINTTMNINVFQAAAEAEINNIAFASSVQVFAGHRGKDDLDQPSVLEYLPVDGQAPARPGNAYALSKQASEDMLRHFALLDPAGSYTALRFPYLFHGDAARAARRAREREPRQVPGKPDEVFSLLLFSDAAELIRLILEQPRPGYWQYFPSASDMLHGWTVAEAVRQLYPTVPLRKPIEQLTGLVDTREITEAVGWKPVQTDAYMRAVREAAADDLPRS